MAFGNVGRLAALSIGVAALFSNSAYAQTIQEAEPTYDASLRVAKPLPAKPLSGPVVPPLKNLLHLFLIFSVCGLGCERMVLRC